MKMTDREFLKGCLMLFAAYATGALIWIATPIMLILWLFR